MSDRPRSITVIGWMFVAAGVVGLTYHASEFDVQRPFDAGLLGVSFLRLFAILCGAFTLRGRNWARWGLVAWLGFHVVVSALHSPVQLLMHGVLFAVVAYFLFRSQASAYFRASRTAVQASGAG
jgi:hypothetical protein